jgi:diadenosine tetraphosphate (Ap4A) HIT family hydrolase
MLARALPVAQALGINPALLTCDPTNLGSRAVIERARGILENCGNGQLASGYPPPQRNPDHPVDADLRPSGSPDRPQPRAAHRRKRIRTLEHVAGEQDATVREEDRGLVILTAMADARRVEMDWQAYHRLVRRACFVCELLADKPNYAHHVVHRDGVAVAFLSRFPLWPGHLLVAPATHVEDVVAVDVAQYLAVQRVVHAAGRALVAEVETERLYVLSLGSLQGNRHVHWHLVPLPPGVPYEQQQVTALAPERGHLDIPDQAQADLASRLRIRMNLDSVSGS